MTTKQEEVIGNPKYLAVLDDHGFVGLVDSMGNDESIVQAARVSYGKGTKKTSEDRGLIRYLVRHLHTTPLEMVEFKFHAKMPIFVARQWIRHRTASVNEYSGRYSVLGNEYYIPAEDNIQPQSKSNNQGREGDFTEETKTKIISTINSSSSCAYADYESLLDKDLARELARMVLPTNYYTEWYWKIDLHNLFHFLKLRMDEHAQYEIRAYANAIYHLVKPLVPIACEAFEDYILHGAWFSKQELQAIREMASENVFNHTLHIGNDYSKKNIDEWLDNIITADVNKREREEFLKKLNIEEERD